MEITRHTAILGTFGRAIAFIGAWAQIISASDLVWVIADGIRQTNIVGLHSAASEER